MRLTQAQLDAFYKVYQRWQSKTGHNIMPQEFEVVPDEDYRKGDYVGTWVGTPTENTPHGRMFLGIEWDGHTHS